MAGCSDGKVQSTVSRIEDDVSNAVSRVESALDPDASDGFPDEDEISSMPDYSSSQGGGINSGDEDIVNGTESDTGSYIEDDDESRLESRADEDDSEASKDTKDM